MINKLSFLKGLFLALLAVTLMAGTANAVAATVSCNGTNSPANQIYNNTGVGGTLLAAGKYVQIIQSADITPGNPDLTTGIPSGDTIVSTGTLATNGNFSGSGNISSSNYIYIRAWETWNGTGAPSGKYGTSAPSSVGSGFVFTYKPASFATTTDLPVQATLSTISPNSRGQGAQSQNLTLTGTNFQDGATVQFSGSGITVNSVTFNSATQLTVSISVASSASTGARNVTVTNPGAAASNATVFTVNAGPLATSANPAAADQGFTGNVVLTGTSFHSGTWTAANVVFSGSGITVNAVTYNSATQLTVNVAVAAGATAGARTVTLTNPDDAGVLTSSAILTVNTVSTAPTITRLEQTSAPGVPITSAGIGDGISIIGSNFGATQGTSTIAINGTAVTAFYYWSAGKIDIAVPTGATSGNVVVTVNGVASNGQPLTINSAPPALSISTNSLPNGTVGVTYSQTLQASGGTAPYTAWAITVGSLPAGLSLNTSTGMISGTPTTAQTANFTVQVTDSAAKTATRALSITIDPAGVVTTPNISGINPATAYLGQTIIISGSNFGAGKGASTVTIGGQSAKPAAWSDSSISVAIPSGVASGSAQVVVTVSGKTGNSSVTVDTSRTYLEDFEGGSVGNWTIDNNSDGNPDSGYYAFGTGIEPNNSTITANGPQAEAAKEGAKGMKVKYSYTSDWGGGWGAALANQLNLSSADKINLYVKWDGSSNDVKVSLKDADGTSYAAAITNTTLTALSGYGLVSLDKSSFAYDKDGSDAGADASFNWSNVGSYNFVYTAKGTTANYQYIDSIFASTGSTPPPPPPTGDDPVITSIDPVIGPAGTRMTITGYNFRDKDTSTSRKVLFISGAGAIVEASIISWESTQITLTVPAALGTGAYDVKVLVEVPSASDPSIIRSFYSNPAAFTVTAAAPPPGTIIAYPTPFNPNSGNPLKVEFDPGSATNIGVYIFDMTARLVKRENITGGQFTWDGKDMYNLTVGDGVFLVRIVNNENQSLIAKGKILVVKK
ncbi:MAG: IPT/TIG domain-containing protein [Candidatus Margulisiibacteriota bacterium]